MGKNEFLGIIDEYKTQNNIVNITEEEILLLFGESCLYPILYMPASGSEAVHSSEITEYELYLLEKGINIVEPAPKIEYQKILADEFYADERMDKYGIGLDFTGLQEGEWEYELEQEIISKNL
jgi:hypothetical protein